MFDLQADTTVCQICEIVNVKNLVSTLYAKRLALQCIRGVDSNPGEGVQQNLLAQ